MVTATRTHNAEAAMEAVIPYLYPLLRPRDIAELADELCECYGYPADESRAVAESIIETINETNAEAHESHTYAKAEAAIAATLREG